MHNDQQDEKPDPIDSEWRNETFAPVASATPPSPAMRPFVAPPPPVARTVVRKPRGLDARRGAPMAPALPAPELTAREIRDWCDYLTIPSGVAADPDLSPGAKLAYGWLLRFGEMRKGFACPSHAALGEKIGVKERQVQRYIDELVRRDLIVVVPRPRLSNRYAFLKHPLLTEKRRRKAGRT